MSRTGRKLMVPFLAVPLLAWAGCEDAPVDRMEELQDSIQANPPVQEVADTLIPQVQEPTSPDTAGTPPAQP